MAASRSGALLIRQPNTSQQIVRVKALVKSAANSKPDAFPSYQNSNPDQLIDRIKEHQN